MGTIYKAVCPNCKYEELFQLGGGLMSIDLPWNLRFLAEKDQETIRKMEAEGDIANFSVENKLTACIHCEAAKDLKKKTIIQITDKSGKRHRFGSGCERCGKELRIYEEVGTENGKVVCPVCGKAHLSFERAGFWD